MNKHSSADASAQRPASRFGRRSFLTGAAAAGAAVLPSRLVFGTSANKTVTYGLIGCGGRGVWMADLFKEFGGYQMVGCADYFADRTKPCGERFGVPEDKRFTGLDGYKRLIDAKPEAIVIESPPYFHPEQAAAGVDAGCHVYVAKPIAVDVPGCLTIEQAGRKATEKKRCFLVDFQSRANDFYREAVGRVHAGAIGPIGSAEAVYYCGGTWGGSEELAKDPKNPELRLRAWGIDRVLSGDVITEQNIHSLDIATWILNNHPQKAVGSCNKKRSDPGTCNDNFSVVFTFPGEVLLTFASKQYGQGHDDIGCRAFGPDGMIETHYGGRVFISGKKSYKGGVTPSIYRDGAFRNIGDFHKAIMEGDYANPTVAPSVRSNLTTIVGRTAAHRRAEVTWDEVLKTAEKYEFDTSGLKS